MYETKIPTLLKHGKGQKRAMRERDTVRREGERDRKAIKEDLVF